MKAETNSSSGVQSLERAFALLSMLAQHHEYGLTMRQIVVASGMTRPTVHRMLMFLLRMRYVEQDETNNLYRLGSASMLLGMRTMTRPPIVADFIHTMRRLARRTNETVFLIVRIGDYSYNIHHEQISPISPVLKNLVGATRLLGLGVGSLSLMALMSDNDIKQHYSRHQARYALHNLSLSKLLTGIERTRVTGYSVASGEGGAGAGFAFDYGPGQAAISVFSSRSRLPLSRRHEYGALVAYEVRSQLHSS